MKSAGWINRKYFGRFDLKRQDNSTFGSKESRAYLSKFAWYKIERHILVKRDASPDDPNLREYWLERIKAKAKDKTPSWQKLSNRQYGLCILCDESLFNDEVVQTHHIIKKSLGGKDTYANLALAHLVCHQQITALENLVEKSR